MLFLKRLIKYLITPRSFQKDESRREFILNILLVSTILLAVFGLTVSVIHYYTLDKYYGSLPITLLIFVLFLCLLLWLSRKGLSKVSASIFIIFLLLSVASSSLRWGADVPIALLVFSLIIVMTGILIGTKSAFAITAVISVGLIILSILQIYQLYKPIVYWKEEGYNLGDVIMRVVILIVIAVVSWLSNREIEKSLKRARVSEDALKRQRDRLEILVEKRTKELKLAQSEKLAQLYRFAQFGRMASGLFHDLANPLNLVSLNLDRLRRESKKEGQQNISDIKVLLKRAVDGTSRLESFVQAARRQVQNQENPKIFSLTSEITQVIKMLEHKAKKSHVKISLKLSKGIKMFGNSMKFGQLITNLVLNAIDAYEHVKRKEKLVEVRLEKINSHIKLEVADWGSGIDEKYLPKIFDPLFTTKSHGKGIGMGLSICKDVVEKDLKGKCKVTSKLGVGTTFIVEFPIERSFRRIR